ncbi:MULTISPECIES: TRAP transporter substrate-binding protein [unclassified Nitratireductor]|uniref:TRAP transporter substrate-binding protein n=1 Tax=unclassified Nitratireductor TaxID=2641084 RepID=UPI0025E49CB2|nr:TRAP transporter substrate-binding protein [Nitratireductor sp.]
MRGSLLALAVAMGGSLTESAQAQGVTASLNHQMTGTIVDEAVQRMSASLTEESGGDIKINVFSRGEMGGERDMFDLMQSGAIEMGVTGSVIVSAIAPEYGPLDAPYLFSSPEHLHKVMNGEVGAELRDAILERKGIRIIGRMDRAPRHVTTSGKAVRKPEDLQGIKIRMREIPVQVQAFRLLGASPVPMAFGEVYTALQTGVIDAQENPLDIIMGTSLNEVQDTIILTGHVREVQWLVVSELWWSNLSEEVRAKIQSAADQAMQWGQEKVYAADSNYLEQARSSGMTIVELSPEELSAFQAAVADLPKQFEGQWKKGLFERIAEQAPN